ncbi:hypothetical protein IWX49DRAFT_432570 [Phyllosticta citricarpa]
MRLVGSQNPLAFSTTKPYGASGVSRAHTETNRTSFSFGSGTNLKHLSGSTHLGHWLRRPRCRLYSRSTRFETALTPAARPQRMLGGHGTTTDEQSQICALTSAWSSGFDGVRAATDSLWGPPCDATSSRVTREAPRGCSGTDWWTAWPGPRDDSFWRICIVPAPSGLTGRGFGPKDLETGSQRRGVAEDDVSARCSGTVDDGNSTSGRRIEKESCTARLTATRALGGRARRDKFAHV